MNGLERFQGDEDGGFDERQEMEFFDRIAHGSAARQDLSNDS